MTKQNVYDFPAGHSRRSREPLAEALDAALAAAFEPGCAKDRRGAAVWHSVFGNLTAASNGPPRPFACDASEACRAACGKLAAHAEMRAVLTYLRIAAGRGVRDFTVLHIRIVDGGPAPSGPPSCITCSRDMLEAGARSIWLWHADGWREYQADEFHALSLQHEKHRLPVIRSRR